MIVMNGNKNENKIRTRCMARNAALIERRRRTVVRRVAWGILTGGSLAAGFALGVIL